MTPLTVILALVAVVSCATAIASGAFAIRGLVKIAAQHAPDRFSSAGHPRFSIWQLHDFSTYISAFRLLLSTPGIVVPDSACRRCLDVFRLFLIIGVVAIVWLTLR